MVLTFSGREENQQPAVVTGRTGGAEEERVHAAHPEL